MNDVHEFYDPKNTGHCQVGELRDQKPQTAVTGAAGRTA